MQEAWVPQPVYLQPLFIGKRHWERLSVREGIIQLLLRLNAGGEELGDVCV